MEYKIKVYSIWEYGKRKDADGNPHQEDSTYPMPDEIKDSDRTFVLCDGMGGHDAGEVASATVCRAMGNYILNDGHDSEGVFTDDDLMNALNAAFDALDRKDNGAEKKMGTTMTFLKLHNDGATIAHIGDSRVYHIRPGKDGEQTQILFETEDHSLVNDLVKIGELTREEAHLSNQKNVITRAMQPNMGRRPKADIKHITDIKAGDYFYMCSDGMLEDVDMDNGNSLRNIFSDVIGSAQRKVEILRSVTEDNRDNHTALIIHVEEVTGSVSQPAAKDYAAPAASTRIGIVEGGDEPETVRPAGEEKTSVPELKQQEWSDVVLDEEESTPPAYKQRTAAEPAPTAAPVAKPAKGAAQRPVAPRVEKAVDKVAEATADFSPRPKSSVNYSKLILRTIIIAVLIAAAYVAIEYLPFFKEKKVDKTELKIKTENIEKENPTPANGNHDIQRPAPQRPAAQQAASRPAATLRRDSTTQGSGGQEVQPQQAPGTTEPQEQTSTGVSEQTLNNQEGVVDSDEQKITNPKNKEKKKDKETK